MLDLEATGRACVQGNSILYVRLLVTEALRLQHLLLPVPSENQLSQLFSRKPHNMPTPIDRAMHSAVRAAW